MHIEKYISFAFQNGRTNSPYQIVLDKAEDAYTGDASAIREELIGKYAAFLGGAAHDNEEKYAFLSYHETAYTGNPELYLDFVRWTYKELWHENHDPATLEWFKRKLKPVVKGWLAYRHNGFEAAPASPGDDPRITVMDAWGVPIPAALIRFWFGGELLIENKDRDQIMDPDDFDLFMRSWFAGTGHIAVIPPGSYLKSNVSARHLMDIIKRFYRGYGKGLHNKGLRRKMIELMPLTFEKLKDFKLTTIDKNL